MPLLLNVVFSRVSGHFLIPGLLCPDMLWCSYASGFNMPLCLRCIHNLIHGNKYSNAV